MYHKIEQEILTKIESGQLPSGSQIPSETELAAKYNVSRITAKRALDNLVQRGLVYRQQGKGTYVCPERIHDISGFGSFSEDMLGLGLQPSSLIIKFEEIEPASEVREQLKIKATDHVYCLKRLRYANQEPVAIETAYLPAHLFPGLLSEKFDTQSLYAVIRLNYRIFPVWADAEIEAGSAEKDAAIPLMIKSGAPVLIARRRTYSETFTVIESTTSVYRGDRFTFKVSRQFIGW